MATASQSRSEPLAVGGWSDDGEPDSKSERYLARRLAAASADYKGVALTTFLLAAAVGTLAWIACGVLLEHWLVPGGLPRWARWAWLSAGLASLAAAGVRWILPLVRYRVNLVYAARVIEREHPELHNDLVNTVLVKAHPEGNAATVVKSLERRAAKRLSGVPSDSVIDRSWAVRLASALALLVGLACLYSLFAPKSMFTTAARLLAPWSRVAAPTRVRFESPLLMWRMPGENAAAGHAAADEPHAPASDPRHVKVDAGGATLVRGRQLIVSSTIAGLRRGERPMVAVTPLLEKGGIGGAAVPWQVEMTRVGAETGEGQRYAAVLPDAVRGLDQSLTFTMKAGDAVSEPIRVAIVDSPSLLVREVRYEFPAYTEREHETVAWQGDLRAVEGTRVVIVAESNQPLESAWIDFDCDGSRDLKLKVGASDLARASGSFVLQMNADRTAAEHATYRLLFQPRGASLAGREQVEIEKLEHRIEVQADLAPEITIEEPVESPAVVPPDAPVTVRVRAIDPDFGLARVGIETRVQGSADQLEIALPGSERRTAFSGAVRLVPARLGAGAGKGLEYRGVAVDTRPKQPNVTHTPWKLLQIDAAAPPRQPQKNPPRSDAGNSDSETRRGDDGGRDEDSSAGEAEAAGSTDGRDGGDSGGMEGRKDHPDSTQGAPQERGRGEEGGEEGRRKNPQPVQSQRNPPQPGDGEQGEPQPGQQGGSAEGSQQGGKQPQAAGQKKQQASSKDASSEGKGGESGGGDGAGMGKGDKAADGSGEQGDKKQGVRKQGAGRRGDDGSGNGGRQSPRSAVSSDGTNDGEALERILEHRRQAGGKSPDGRSTRAPSEPSTNSGGQDQSQGQTGRDAADGGDQRPAGDVKGGGDGSSGRDKPRGESAPATSKDGDGTSRERAEGAEGNEGKKSFAEPKAGKDEGIGGEQPSTRQSGGERQAGERQGDPKQSGAKDGSKDDADGRESGQESAPCAGPDGKPCGKEGCAACNGGGKSSGSEEGSGQGQGQPSQGQPSQSQQGQSQQGQGQPSQGQQGQGQQGQSQQGQGQQGQGQQGQGQPGQGQEKTAEGTSDSRAQQQEGKPASGPSEKGGAERPGDPGQQGEPGSKSGGQPSGGVPPQPDGRSSPAGGGGWSEGDAAPPPGGSPAEGPPAARDVEWGPQELANARNAADLALEHLRSSVESGRTDVLDELGWTRDQARAFLERWEAMRRRAESPDGRQRGEFERVLRSLGLRPAGAQNSRDVPADMKGGQAEGRRSRPPSDYRERFKAFLQGTGGDKNRGESGDAGPGRGARDE